MEFRHCLKILKKDARLFWSVVLTCTFLALIWQQSQIPRFGAIQLLNIGRSGNQATSDYTYDGFYRLQADERFADTVVRWLGSVRVARDIHEEAEIKGEGDPPRTFTARRLSSQMIEVRYESAGVMNLEELGRAIPTVLNRYTESLNQDFREPTWFVIVPTEPVIRDARLSAWPIILGGMAVGLFLAFWLVLFRHYFRKTNDS